MTTPSSAVLVVLGETLDGTLDPAAAELIGAAALLGQPVALTRQPAHVEALGQLGAQVVLTAADTQDASLVDAAVAAFNACNPAAVVVAHTVGGRDVAARLAVRKQKVLLTDAVGVARDAEGVITEHANYGGAYTATAAATYGAPIITLRIGSVEHRAEPAQPQVHALEVVASGVRTAEVLEVTPVVRESSRPELATAERVVAGGVALGDADMFEELVGGLADALDAAVGATRSAADEGQIGHDAQIGQTGIVVSPKLYIGIGISGAVQHLVGMQTADTIVAINNDEDAPIFDIADFGIIGDLFDLVPEIIKEIQARKAAEA